MAGGREGLGGKASKMGEIRLGKGYIEGEESG